jgi:hypothetical protein
MHRFQSILIPVTEAEPLVGSFRRAGDWSSAHGVPSHLTIAGPWPLSLRLPLEDLGELAGAIQGIRYAFSTVGTLGDVVCLFPEDDGVLLRWRTAIIETVGTADALDEDWRLHLTVCRGATRAAVGAVEEAVGEALPLACEVPGLLLVQMLGDSDVTMRPL